MKKFLALLLAVLMILSLAACGKDADDSGNNNAGNNNASNSAGENNQGGENNQVADTWEAAVERLAKCTAMGDTENLEKLAPEAFWLNYEKSGLPRSSMLDEAAYASEASYAYFQGQLGEDLTYTLNIDSKEDVDAATLATIASCMEEQKGIAADQVTAACKVTATITVKGTAEIPQMLETTAIQIDGQWYCAMVMIWDEGAYVVFEIEMMVGG